MKGIDSYLEKKYEFVPQMFEFSKTFETSKIMYDLSDRTVKIGTLLQGLHYKYSIFQCPQIYALIVITNVDMSIGS